VTEFFQSYAQADPVVRALGGIAILVGLFGPITTWLLSGLYRDQRELSQFTKTPDVLPLEKCKGPFTKAYRPYLRAGAAKLPLSPETIVRTLHDSFERSAKEIADRTRIWSYIPLLLGLVGTAWNLRSLLQQQVNPSTLPRLTESMSNALLGTILGVSGALIATLLQRSIVYHLAGVRAAAERYLFDVFAETLPESRVKVQFDEQVLEALNTRIGAVVEAYKQALGPVAKSLEASAKDSAESAQLARAAFAQLADAIGSAQELTAGANKFTTALKETSDQLTIGVSAAGAQLTKDVAAAGDRLAATTSQAAEQLARAGSLAVKAGDTLALQTPVLAHSIAANDAAPSAVREAIGKLESASGKLGDEVLALRGELAKFLTATSEQAVKLTTELGTLNTETNKASERVADLSDEITGLREAVSNFGDARVESITASLTRGVDHIQNALQRSLTELPGHVVKEMGQFNISATQTEEHLARLESLLAGVETAFKHTLTAAEELADATVRFPMGPIATTVAATDSMAQLERAMQPLIRELAIMSSGEERTWRLLDERLPKPKVRKRKRNWLMPWRRTHG